MKKKGNAYWLEGGKSAVARKVGNKMERRDHHKYLLSLVTAVHCL